MCDLDASLNQWAIIKHYLLEDSRIRHSSRYIPRIRSASMESFYWSGMPFADTVHQQQIVLLPWLYAQIYRVSDGSTDKMERGFVDIVVIRLSLVYVEYMGNKVCMCVTYVLQYTIHIYIYTKRRLSDLIYFHYNDYRLYTWFIGTISELSITHAHIVLSCYVCAQQNMYICLWKITRIWSCIIYVFIVYKYSSTRHKWLFI